MEEAVSVGSSEVYDKNNPGGLVGWLLESRTASQLFCCILFVLRPPVLEVNCGRHHPCHEQREFLMREKQLRLLVWLPFSLSHCGVLRDFIHTCHLS